MSNNSAVTVDASTILKFVLYDEVMHLQAVALIEDLVQRNTKLLAPSIFTYECDSVIRRHVHLKVLSSDDANEIRQLIAALGIVVIHDASIFERAWQIASEYKQPRVYDAAYAAFAETRKLDLWTADTKFYNAVQKELDFVKCVKSYKPHITS